MPFLEFAFFVILASLVLLCVVVAKLRDVADRRTADRAPTSSLGSRKDSTGEGGAARRNTRSDSGDSAARELASGDRTASVVGIAGSKEPDGVCAGTGTEPRRKECDEIDGGLADDDEWEGVERSQSARLFGRAVRFACSARNADLISGIHGEPTMKLYGLHRVALEGPCREHRPMTFKVSARAKWNAWQRLGNISPEVATEEYIDLLSEKFPNWMQNDAVEDEVCTDAEAFWKLICNLRTAIEQQTKIDRNRLQKLNPAQ